MASDPRSRAVLERIRQYESPNVTFIKEDYSWPIVWHRAKGMFVWDLSGKKYIDFTSAFGVAAAGHAAPAVVAAARKQLGQLAHAMGDVHPHPLKADLCQLLSRLTFERWEREPARSILCNSGFEAVEAALKTAKLLTGRPGVVSFMGGYHGLGYGALNATHRSDFRKPFEDQLKRFTTFVPFPEEGGTLGNLENDLTRLVSKKKIGAVLVEPVQGRGGIRVPHPQLLAMLRKFCDRHGICLIVDEIMTGFGRTGKWFAVEHFGVVPDLICLGKAMTGGFPLSAAVGRAKLMESAWPRSTGEAIHTSGFLGNPVGCSMAIAQIGELRRLLPRVNGLGRRLQLQLSKLKVDRLQLRVRGYGLMAGLEMRNLDQSPATEKCLAVVERLLQQGYLFLPEGAASNVLAFLPPLMVTEQQVDRTVRAVSDTLHALEGS